MNQVLAVRVGAKESVGHIVSKRWWPATRDHVASFWQAIVTAALGWAALGSHLQTKIWHFAMSLATLDEPFSGDHVEAKAEPGPIFGDFFWRLSKKNAS